MVRQIWPWHRALPELSGGDFEPQFASHPSRVRRTVLLTWCKAHLWLRLAKSPHGTSSTGSLACTNTFPGSSLGQVASAALYSTRLCGSVCALRSWICVYPGSHGQFGSSFHRGQSIGLQPPVRPCCKISLSLTAPILSFLSFIRDVRAARLRGPKYSTINTNSAASCCTAPLSDGPCSFFLCR